jgi:hypothetical protein
MDMDNPISTFKAVKIWGFTIIQHVINKCKILLQFSYLDLLKRNVGLFIATVIFNPLRTGVYFCHQNQNAKNIGNFTTVLKPHNSNTGPPFERY